MTASVEVADQRETMRAGLEDWLRVRLPDASGVSLSPLRLPSGTGNSAETTFAELRYADGGGPQHRDLVIRRQLSGTDLFLDSDIELPHNFMTALEHYPDLPSPVSLGVETDPDVIGNPFLVMESVSGRIVNQVPNYNVEGWLADLPVEQRADAWHTAIGAMAKLHNIDWQEHFGFLADPARGKPGLDQFLGYSADWYRWAQAGRELSVADAALEWLYANKPGDAETCVCWGDPSPANTLFAPDNSVAAILDFEMANLGPGETDLTWWLETIEHYSTYSGVAKLEGLPQREETIAIYEEFRGRKVANLDYYTLLTWFRQNTVGIRFSDRLVANGIMPDGTDILTHNVATNLMAGFLGMPECPPGEGFMMMGRGVAGAQAD